jgi:hypothetical protein
VVVGRWRHDRRLQDIFLRRIELHQSPQLSFGDVDSVVRVAVAAWQ